MDSVDQTTWREVRFMAEGDRDLERPGGAVPIPEAAVRRIVGDRRAQAELTLVTNQLNALPELKRDPEAKVNRYVDGLIARRAELLERVASAPPVRSLQARPIDSVVTTLGPFFSSWARANVSYFSEGVNEVPGVAGTSGGLSSARLFPGGFEFVGVDQLNDVGTVQPSTPKWWVHTWTGTQAFPAPAFNSTLYYRFTTDTDFRGAASAQAGLVTAFVTIGTTADVHAGGPFDPGALEAAGWPFQITLPQDFMDITVHRVHTPVSGSIQVKAGRTAAIGFIYGIIAGIASGFVASLDGGGMGTWTTGPDASQRLDEIEYRFEPDWWVQAVGQRLDQASVTS
jgi:hypothetical protein